MNQRTSLRDFQEQLAAKLASVKQGDAPRALLGVESGGARWLVDLADSGEVVPLAELAPVPLTKPWFAGLANVRGVLYSVVDFAAFRGLEPTPRGAAARLLLIGARHGSNSALLVERAFGLRSAEGMTVAPAADAGPAWIGAAGDDADGTRWLRLDVPALLADPRFLDVGLDFPMGG